MKVAFVSGNREVLPDPVVPLGLLSVMASTPDQHETRLLDLCFDDAPLATLAAELTAFEPDIVAVGMRNIQNSDYSDTTGTIGYYEDLVAAARDCTEAAIVIGGSGFSVMPRQLMAQLRADYGISGEGEVAFPLLLQAIERDTGFDHIGNLHRFERGMVKSNPPPSEFIDMSNLPVPDRSIVSARYYRETGIDSIQTKRGCPLECSYCTYPIIEGRVGRTRSPEAVADEMERALAAQPATDHFFIVDSVFNLPVSHAKAVCRELIRRRWSVPWTCYANPLGFDAEMAELAAAAGCVGVEIGSDSGTNAVLERLNKGFTTEHIRRIHERCAAAGIRDCHTFILGTDGESEQDVAATLEFIVDLDPFAAVLMTWVDDREALDPVLRAQRQRFRDDIHTQLAANADVYRHWSIPPLGINFDGAMFQRLRRAGMRGPLWQHIRGPAHAPTSARSQP